MANPDMNLETTSTADTAATPEEPEVQEYMDPGREPDPDQAEEPAAEAPEEGEETRAADTPERDPEDDEYSERVQKRIGKLVARQREAERDAQHWRERAERLEEQEERKAFKQQPDARGDAQDQAPKEDDFDTYEDFIAAKAGYIAERKIREEFTQRQRIEQARAKEAQVRAKLARGEEKWPDFAATVYKSTAQGGPTVTQPMFEACNDSERTDEIAYYLAKHVDVSEQIARLSPIGVARAIGRIEADIESGRIKLVAPTTTKAPPPIPDRIGGKQPAGADVDPDKLPIGEWMKRNREGSLKYR